MFWVGRNVTDHLVPIPCYGQGHRPLDQAAQSPIQPGLQCFWALSVNMCLYNLFWNHYENILLFPSWWSTTRDEEHFSRLLQGSKDFRSPCTSKDIGLSRSTNPCLAFRFLKLTETRSIHRLTYLPTGNYLAGYFTLLSTNEYQNRKKVFSAVNWHLKTEAASPFCSIPEVPSHNKV